MAGKSKRLTQKQKNANREAKKRLQAKGILPPDKKKLNRKKFIDETINEWRNREHSSIWDIYLAEAAMIISARTDVKHNISLEAVGAAKVLKMALKTKEFEDKMREEGRTKYTYQEKIDYLWDTFQA